MRRTGAGALAALWLGIFGAACGSDVAAFSGCAGESKACVVLGRPTCVPTNDPSTGCASLRCDSCQVQGWQHAQPKCDALGNCAVLTCERNWGDCVTNATDGCETNLLISDAHCGICQSATSTCGTRPNATSHCLNGACTIGPGDCLAGYVDCNGTESDGCECGPNKTCVNRVCI